MHIFWSDDLNIDKLVGGLNVKVVGEVPLDEEYTLFLLSSDATENIILFDEPWGKIRAIGRDTGNFIKVYNNSGEDVLILPGTILSGGGIDRVFIHPEIVEPTYGEPVHVECYPVEIVAEEEKACMEYGYTDIILLPTYLRAITQLLPTSNETIASWIKKWLDNSYGGKHNFLRSYREYRGMLSKILRPSMMLSLCSKSIYRIVIAISRLRGSIEFIISRMSKNSDYLKELFMENINYIRERKKEKRCCDPLMNWIERIINICSPQRDIPSEDKDSVHDFLRDLYSTLHFEERSRLPYLRVFEYVVFWTIYRKIISVISRYSGLGEGYIRDCLERRGGVDILIEKTMAIKEIKDMKWEIYEEARNFRYEFDYEYKILDGYVEEMEEIFNGIVHIINQVNSIEEKLIATRIRLEEHILPKAAERNILLKIFGFLNRDDIIGYCLSKKEGIIFVEIFPSHPTKKLWINIMQSILNHIIDYDELLRRMNIEYWRTQDEEQEIDRILRKMRQTTSKETENYEITITEKKYHIETIVKRKEGDIIYYMWGKKETQKKSTGRGVWIFRL